jgi:acetolactate synthase-1/2/3 large subunit
VYHVDKVRRPIAEDKALNKAVAWLKDAKHPLLVIGAGANRKVTSNMLRRLVENTGLPFCDTQMGKGVIDSRDPRYMGTAALSDGDYIHAVMGSADLILVVGHDVVEKPPFFMHHTDERKVIHCSYYGAQVDQVYFPQLEVVGDVGNAIWRISEAIKSKPPHWDLRYFQYVREQMLGNLDWQTKCSDFPLSPPLFVSLLRGAVPEKGIVCLDNGLYKVWMARQYPAYFPNTLLLDNALATMGAGVPSAMAAKIVHPEVAVIAVVGDGGFLMNGAQELGTAIANNIDITIVILNDNCYGMIKWKCAMSERSGVPAFA